MNTTLFVGIVCVLVLLTESSSVPQSSVPDQKNEDSLHQRVKRFGFGYNCCCCGGGMGMGLGMMPLFGGGCCGFPLFGGGCCGGGLFPRLF
ncbi:hypothetical protein Q1695_011947 [Nippostrongylus brasiliensis]|nr:hypothetical protein Q1695_011947 [Nippostrongylus brasiliensis]